MVNADGDVTATIRLTVNLQPASSFPSSPIAQLAMNQCTSSLAEKSNARCDDIIGDYKIARLDIQTLRLEPI